MAQLRTDVIYHWISEDDDDEMFYFSPDGEGRIFFDNVIEAREQTGLTKVVQTDKLED